MIYLNEVPKALRTHSSDFLNSMTFPYKLTYLLPLFTFLWMAVGLAEKANSKKETFDYHKAFGVEKVDPHDLKIISTQNLGGGNRHLSHLQTDKPIYKVGETVYIRAIVLDAHTHKPCDDPRLNIRLSIKGPKGDQMFQQQAPAKDSTLGLSWKIPKETAGGTYKIKTESPSGLFPPSERTFEIRAYRPPHHDIDIVFLKNGYGPGEDVQASVQMERSLGGVPEGAELQAIARVDGQEVYRENLSVPASGRLNLQFSLPKQIKHGEGSLNLQLNDAGQVSFRGKDIPILLHHFKISFYPEGGDLVQGLASRVYFQAYQKDGKPADFKGHLVDEQGQRLQGSIETQHEGRGVFNYTPEQKKVYLKIDEPSGIKAIYALPAPKASGVSLKNITGENDLYKHP